MAPFAGMIAGRIGPRLPITLGALLTGGLSSEEATDVLWALTSYDLYRMLVVERRWPAERYEIWLTHLLIQQLLQPVDG